MKALGAACICTCIAAWSPASARADPIRAGVAATDCRLNAHADLPGSHDTDADDVSLTSRSSLERSLQFAAHGATTDFFSDERESLRHVVDAEGLDRQLQDQLRRLLHQEQHKHHVHADARKGPRGPHAAALTPADPSPAGPSAAGPSPAGPSPAAPSPTPEPASMFLLGTGLAGLFRYRRQLFA
jgi:hypothetical protein